MLPGEDGTQLCRVLRAESDIPIIMLTARSDNLERIIGLELGADDYLTKPFEPRELVARIRAVLRRTLPGETLPELKGESGRSEEHTSELQSLMRISYAVFCL